MKETSQSKRIYMDHAATTPAIDEVVKKMSKYWQVDFGNPSSLHEEGRIARAAVTEARKNISEILNCSSNEIFFTSSGTESANLALLGSFKAIENDLERPRLIVSEVEHPAVLEAARNLQSKGVEVVYLSVSRQGLIDPKEIVDKLNKQTFLVSVMYAQNEIGTIQPVGKIAKEIMKFKNQHSSQFPYFHSDASQAPNYLDIRPDVLGVDLLTLDGSKIYGPKGVGMLYAKKGVRIDPIIFGGGQEKGLRAGTENVPAIVGFAEALKIAVRDREKEKQRLLSLKKLFIEELLRRMPNAIINGDIEESLPNIISVCFAGIDSEFAVIKLDLRKIAVSTGRACGEVKNGKTEEFSEVIRAIGNKNCENSSIRFSFGRSTVRGDVLKCLNTLEELFGDQ